MTCPVCCDEIAPAGERLAPCGAPCCEGHETAWAKGYALGFRDGVAAPGHRAAAARTAGFLAGVAVGRGAMARAFWRGECERLARVSDAEAAEAGNFSVSTQLAHERRADQLRAWAREAA